MGIEALDLVVIVAAIAVGAFIKGATGGGLPQLAIPVMAVFLGVEHAVVVMAIPGVVANGLLVWSHRAEASKTRHLPAMVGAGIVGSVIGTMLLKSLDGRVLSGGARRGDRRLHRAGRVQAGLHAARRGDPGGLGARSAWSPVGCRARRASPARC